MCVVVDDRIPPNDEMAEQSVLGGLMLSTSAIWDVTGVVAGQDFYQPKHQVIFDAIMFLHSKGNPTDVITVSDYLTKMGNLDRAGGAPYLHTLTSLVPTAASSGYYAGIVSEKALLRRLVEAGTRVVQMGYGAEGEADDLVEQARAELDRVARITKANVRNIGATFQDVIVDLEASPKAVPTPWWQLDELIVGLVPGKLYVVGGRPGDGKTIVGLQMARALAARGNVAMCSLEMGQDELTQRLIASMAGVDMGSLARHTLTDEEWTKVAEVRPRIAPMPLFVDDRPGLSITQIKSFARSVARKGQLGGVVVDYLQLISGTSPKQSRYEIVSEVARQLKNMAKELGCPVIALSQLNRGEKNLGKSQREPTLSDLRESGEIENAADVVLLLQRHMEDDGKPGTNLKVIVAKNRSGLTGRRTLRWEARFARVVTSPVAMYDAPVPD